VKFWLTFFHVPIYSWDTYFSRPYTFSEKSESKLSQEQARTLRVSTIGELFSAFGFCPAFLLCLIPLLSKVCSLFTFTRYADCYIFLKIKSLPIAVTRAVLCRLVLRLAFVLCRHLQPRLLHRPPACWRSP
jgi:hypothetical protein